MFNIFSKPTDSTVTGKIIKKNTSTLYTLEDRRGRQFNAESDGSYIVGQTVLVRENIIIGKTKKAKTVFHFNV